MDSASSIVADVRAFVDAEVRPAASGLEHADAYPHALVARLRELGLFGALVPAAYGGLGLDVTTYARVVEELCRGFMSLAGVVNSHTMAALIVLHHGTDEQKRRLLPRFASGRRAVASASPSRTQARTSRPSGRWRAGWATTITSPARRCSSPTGARATRSRSWR